MPSSVNIKTLQYIAAIVVAVFLFSLALRGKGDPPEQVVKDYVARLSAGDCEGAYSLVSIFGKESSLAFQTYGDYKKSVCDPAKRKYVRLRVFIIDNVAVGNDMATVDFRVKLDEKGYVRNRDRAMRFDLRKVGRRWLVDGPNLEL